MCSDLPHSYWGQDVRGLVRVSGIDRTLREILGNGVSNCLAIGCGTDPRMPASASVVWYLSALSSPTTANSKPLSVGSVVPVTFSQTGSSTPALTTFMVNTRPTRCSPCPVALRQISDDRIAESQSDQVARQPFLGELQIEFMSIIRRRSVRRRQAVRPALRPAGRTRMTRALSIGHDCPFPSRRAVGPAEAPGHFRNSGSVDN